MPRMGEKWSLNDRFWPNRVGQRELTRANGESRIADEIELECDEASSDQVLPQLIRLLRTG